MGIVGRVQRTHYYADVPTTASSEERVMRGWVWLTAFALALFPFWGECLRMADGDGTLTWSSVFRRGDTFLVGFTMLLAVIGDVSIYIISAQVVDGKRRAALAAVLWPLLGATANVLMYASRLTLNSILVWAGVAILIFTGVCGWACARYAAGRGA